MPGHDRGPIRSCAGCGRPLSRYNAGRYCQSCHRSDDGSGDPALAKWTPEMGRRLRELRKRRRMTQVVLADFAGMSPSMLSMIETGARPLNRYADVLALASALRVPPSDIVPGLRSADAPSTGFHPKGARAEGVTAVIAARSASGRQRGRAIRSSGLSRAVEALQVTMSGNGDGLDIAEDGLAELVGHYAHAVAVVPSVAVYDELVGARSFAGTLLDRGGRARRPDLAVTTGWLSSLLAISAADLGDHAASVMWCADTERRGRDAGVPELLGWAALTRSLIAWYQGDPVRSAAAARQGQAEAIAGTVARAKLAAQEMRCLAMVGDMAGMSAARRGAAAAMSQLGPSAPVSGIYSVPRAEDPPYTATSLLLAGRYGEAAEMTRRIIATTYSSGTRVPTGQPTSYARTLLILALAAVGLGEIDEAAAAGMAALESGRVVWSTMVLAGKLDQSLAVKSPGSAHAADFRARYIDAGMRLALPAALCGEGTSGE
jgi:transcriptional regulator with XRE-family HTH domain